MDDLILACVGAVIAAAGGIYMAGLMYFRNKGVRTEAEVVSSEEVKKRTGIYLGNIAITFKVATAYVHTLKYMVDGRWYEAPDKAGYTNRMENGTKRSILCDPKDMKKIRYEDDVERNIRITGALIAVALVFAGRFLYSYLK